MTSRCGTNSPSASAFSSPPSTTTIVESNRRAIKNLLRGNRAEALVLFQQALNTARSVLLEADQRHLQQRPQRRAAAETDAMDDDGDSSCHRSSSPPSPSSKASPSATTAQHRPQEAPWIESIAVGAVVDGSFRFYDCAFDLSDACAEAGALTHPDCQLEMSAVLIYNMALVYHQVGLLTGNSKHLYKALNLYEMGALIFETPTTATEQGEDKASSASALCGFELLQLALYNNMAHIHRHFMNAERSSHCEYMLHEALVRIQQQQRQQAQAQQVLVQQPAAQQVPARPQQQVLSTEHLGFFTVNVFFANTRMSCAPAA